MRPGDKINLKDGRKGIITGVGLGDFLGDPAPVYVQIEGSTERIMILSDELKKTTGVTTGY